MTKALMISAVVLVSAVLWGEEPPAPQTAEQPKEEASPAQKDEPATPTPVPAPEVSEKKDDGAAASEKAKKTEEKTEPVAEKKEEKVEEDTRSFWEIAFSTDERKKKGDEEKRWFFSLGAQFQWLSGNQSPFSGGYPMFGGMTSAKWDNNITKVTATYQTQYMKTYPAEPILNEDGVVSNGKMSGIGDFLLTTDHYFANRWEFFAFTQTMYNDFWNLTLRINVGAGIKFVIFRNKYVLFDIGVAPMFEAESYLKKKLLPKGRASGRMRLEVTPLDFIAVGGKFFYVPNIIDHFNDFRYTIEAFLRFNYFINEEKTQMVTVGFTYKHEYNSDPNPYAYTLSKTVQKIDQQIISTIGVNF